MKTITLDVSDELAGRLAPLQSHLPNLLSFALDLLGVESLSPAATVPNSPMLKEVIDFLAHSPSYAQIIGFKISPEAQLRLEELLDMNREGRLAPQEKAELDTYQQAHHLLILLKARARVALASSN